MNILVIGGGGREHALVWKLKQSPRVERIRSEEHTSELQSQSNFVCRPLLEKKKGEFLPRRPRRACSRTAFPDSRSPKRPTPYGPRSWQATRCLRNRSPPSSTDHLSLCARPS